MGAETSEADTLNVELASMLRELPHPCDISRFAASLLAEEKHHGSWGDPIFLSFSHKRSSSSHSEIRLLRNVFAQPDQVVLNRGPWDWLSIEFCTTNHNRCFFDPFLALWSRFGGTNHSNPK